VAARNRLAALRLIDRIKQHEMETIGSDLARLRAAQKDIDDQSQKLRHDAQHEASTSTDETRKFLPSFLASVDIRQATLSKQRQAMDKEVSIAETKLFAAFRETKTTEQVLGKVVREIAQEDARAATVEMDDATRSLFLLQRRAQQTQ
jgi:hypothetical protein